MQLVVVAAGFTMMACSPPLSEVELVERATSALARGDISAAELDIKTALQQNSENSLARSLYGQIYVRQINPSAAIGEFERALNAVDSEETRLLLAKALVQAGESAELLSDVDAGVYSQLDGNPEFQAVTARAHLAQAEEEDARTALAAADLEGNDFIDITRAVFELQVDGDRDAAAAILKGVVARSASNAHAWSLLGILAVQDADRAAAEEYFAKAADANPYRFADRLQLVEAQIRLGKSEPAERNLAQLEKLLPNSPEVNFLRGQLYFDERDYDAALGVLSLVLSSNPNHLGALLLSASANAQQGNFATAQRQYTQFLTLRPGHVQASVQLGNVWLQLGDAEKAEIVAREVLEETEMNLPALGLLAMALSTQGMHSESVQAYEQIAALQPESAVARLALGSQSVVAGDTAKGIEQLEAAVALEPGNAIARERLIEAHLSLSDFASAEEQALAYQRAFPDSANPLAYLGRTMFQANKPDGARTAFESALTIEPGQVAATGGLAMLALLEDDYQGAVDLFEAALVHSPGNLVLSMNLAVLLEQDGDLKRMEDVLREAVEANPGVADPRLALARYSAQQNQPEEALQIMTPIESSADTDSRVAEVLAGIYLMLDDPEAASRNAEKLLAQRDGDIAALTVAAKVELANAQPDVAQEYLEDALLIDSSNVELRKMLVDSMVRQGKLDAARLEISKLPDSVQNEPVLLILRGRLAMEAGDPQSAKLLFTRALEQEATSISFGLLTGARWSLEEYDEAMTALRNWVKKNPSDLAILNLLASKEIELGETDAAFERYEYIVSEQPDNLVALNNLAWLSRKTDSDAALQYITKADKAAPKSAQIKDTFAMVELERGEFERALSLNSKALDAAPGNPDIRYNRAQILARAGQKEKAADLLRELVAGPAFASQADATALLDTL